MPLEERGRQLGERILAAEEWALAIDRMLIPSR